MLKAEKQVREKRDRIVYKLNYEYPDINSLSKYGKVTSIKPHSCTPAPKLYGIKRKFRHTNGVVSRTLNKNQTQAMFDSSNLTDLMSIDRLSKSVGFSLRREKYSAANKIQNSKTYTTSDVVPLHKIKQNEFENVST